MNIRPAIAEAIRAKGSQRKLAEACDVSQPAIAKILKKGRVSAGLAVRIEIATGISRERLCPEVFGCTRVRSGNPVVEAHA